MKSRHLVRNLGISTKALGTREYWLKGEAKSELYESKEKNRDVRPPDPLD